MDRNDTSRRQFLAAVAAVPGATLAGLPLAALARDGTLAPTPACRDDDEPTPRQTEGPFYTPDSPLRGDLREAGIGGTPFTLAGLVVTRSCRPVANALVDLWHADERGAYDNAGFRLRGHQFTDEAGRYRFETIVPGLYPGRTRHFHVKYQAPGRSVLTTQLYFPDEPANARDRLFSPLLVLDLRDQAPGTGTFVTVLDVP